MTRYRRLLFTWSLALVALGAALAGLTVVASASQRTPPYIEVPASIGLAGLELVAAAPLTTPTVPAVTLTPSPTPRLPRIRTFSLSARPDGPAQTIFPGGLSTIYARYEYYDFDVPHTVTIQLRDQYGIIFWRSDKSYTGEGTDVLTVTAQTVYANYQTYVDNATNVMLNDLDRALAATNLGTLALHAQNALGAASQLNPGLQQLLRYTPDSAVPHLAAAIGAVHDAENEIFAALTPPITLAQAQARIATARAIVVNGQAAIAAVRAAGPNANVNSLPGTEDEPNLANLRIDIYPVQTIEWFVENPKFYRRIAAPIRKDDPSRIYILTLTNLSNANATLTVQYIPSGITAPVFTQSVPLGAQNSTSYVIQDLAQLPAHFDGYAVISADVPFTFQVIRRPATPTATYTPGGPTLTPVPPTQTPTPTPTGGTSAPTVTVSPTLCPQATPELLAVDPVTSPTDQLSQIVKVYIGNGDAVTITTISGVFVATGNFSTSTPAEVDVALQPNATHDLTVQAHVRRVSGPGGCPYGGYILTTTRDRNGNLLRIVQIQPTLPPGVTPTITLSPTLKPETTTPTATATPSITPTPSRTPTPTAVILVITPAANVAGYVTGQDRGNIYLNSRILWTGIDSRPFTPHVLHGIFQFDLSALPSDAQIVSAEVTLVGVSTTYLDPGTGGDWRLRLLDAMVDTNWTRLNYYHIHNAPADATSPTIVRAVDLAVGRSNTFALDANALDELEARLRTTRKASFRLDLDSVFGVGRAIFGWDSRPTLRITYRR